MKLSVYPPATAYLCAFVAVTLLTGCGKSTPPPDDVSLYSPTGYWIGVKDTSLNLNIEASGDIRYSTGGQEYLGKWESVDDNTIRATINGESYDMPFNRLDLNLSITLPNQTSPTEFTQM